MQVHLMCCLCGSITPASSHEKKMESYPVTMMYTRVGTFLSPKAHDHVVYGEETKAQ